MKNEKPVQIKTCKFCGQEELHWKLVKGEWRLYTPENKIHDCPANPLEEQYVECNRCGKKVRWKKTEDGSKLVDKNGNRHFCKSVKDFKKLKKPFDKKPHVW